MVVGSHTGLCFAPGAGGGLTPNSFALFSLLGGGGGVGGTREGEPGAAPGLSLPVSVPAWLASIASASSFRPSDLSLLITVAITPGKSSYPLLVLFFGMSSMGLEFSSAICSHEEETMSSKIMEPGRGASASHGAELGH